MTDITYASGSFYNVESATVQALLDFATANGHNTRAEAIECLCDLPNDDSELLGSGWFDGYPLLMLDWLGNKADRAHDAALSLDDNDDWGAE